MNNKHGVIAMIAILILSVSLSACEPLRKKFTRQKKKDLSESADFIPVLEPQEYPAPENNPELNYKQNYYLVKAWYKDLWTVLEEKGSDKQAHYTLKQIKGHIDEMRSLVVPEKQAALDKLSGLLGYYNSSLESPAPLRNQSRIQSDLRAFDRQLRNQCRADKLKGYFVAPTDAGSVKK